MGAAVSAFVFHLRSEIRSLGYGPKGIRRDVILGDTKANAVNLAVYGVYEAGEGGRTLDIHVGNVTLYH